MLRYFRLAFLIGLFLSCGDCRSAGYDYVFEHFSTDDGLSHGSVSAMMKDSRGFMWFATWDGINRYDGYEFVTYKPGNPSNSASNRVESIVEDLHGNIWVGTYDSKAFRFNRQLETFMQFPQAKEKEVHQFFMSSKGDVWLSTASGLFHIVTDPLTNETQQTHYPVEADVTISGDRIRFLAEDIAGNIWVNNGKGIVCLAEQLSGSYLPKVLKASVRTRLNQDELTAWATMHGAIVFGTSRGDLLIYDTWSEKLEELSFGHSSPITHISQDGAGRLFLSTLGDGVWVVDGRNRQVLHHFREEGMSHVLKSYADSKGRLWVETLNAGVLKIDLESGGIRHYRQTLSVPEDLRSNPQMGIMEDADQTVWLTLKGGGFGYYNADTDEVEYFFNRPDDPVSRASNYVNCFYKDPSGVLWMSTYFKGIEKVTFIKRKFTYSRPAVQNNLSIANEVRALLYDSQGFLWVATKNREIFVLNDQQEVVHKITTLKGRVPERIYAMMEDSKGQIYLGTRGDGLFVLTRKEALVFDVVHYESTADDRYSLSDNNIYSLLEDHLGRIWVGTYGGGLNLMQGSKFLHGGNELAAYPRKEGQRVRHIAEDEQGRLWIGTTEGLIISEGGLSQPLEFSFINNENGRCQGLLSNDVFWILCDAKHQVWLATLGGGLSKLVNEAGGSEPLKFTTFTKGDGLSSDMVFTIVDDGNGRLWLSSENGISSYDTENRTFRNYNRYDGIVKPGFSEGAVAQSPCGWITFGAINGLYSFRPSGFNMEGERVDLVLTGFRLFGNKILPAGSSVLQRSISETTALKLRHHQNVFSLSWAAMDFGLQDKVQYMCQLEGYDADWRNVGLLNRIDYTRVPPGKYHFRVRVNNPEMRALSANRTLFIEILPPPWKTWWACLSYFILALVLLELTRRIVTTIIHLRNKVQIEKELTDVKLNFFTSVSHELRTPLTLILGPAKELRETEKLTEKGMVYVRLIEQNGARLLRLVNQLLDFRKVQKEKMDLQLTGVDLVPLIKGVCQSFEDLAQRRQIHFQVIGATAVIYAVVDVPKMESVLYNLLSNSFKFTPSGGKVEVFLANNQTDQEVVIEVRDNGPGISKAQEQHLFEVFASHYDNNASSQAGTGIGLALSRELVLLQGGELTYQPTHGGGATFSIRLKGHVEIRGSEAGFDIDEPGTLAAISLAGLEGKNAVSRDLPGILVVEDNDDLRTFLRLQLQDYFSVTEAENGLQGWEMAQDIAPDIVLSDIMMPEMDGIELLDRLKNHFDTSHIPVVLLTAKSSVESKIEGLKYGADAYIAKPFNNEQLRCQLSNLLHQRRLLREKFAGPKSRQKDETFDQLTEKDARFLDRVRDIIEAHLTNSDFRMEILYSALGMGRSKFFDKLKGLTGLSPIDYVKTYRLNKARALLESGQYNVSETSFLSGFSDSGYFSKCFKEKYGINPSEISKPHI